MKNLIKFNLALGLILLLLPSSVLSYKAPVEAPRPSIRVYAEQQTLKTFGGQWSALNTIIWRESKWNSEAKNPKSSAFGLCQFLKSTWKEGKTSDPYKQIDECIRYIQVSYGTPDKAKKFHDIHNYF